MGCRRLRWVRVEAVRGPGEGISGENRSKNLEAGKRAVEGLRRVAREERGCVSTVGRLQRNMLSEFWATEEQLVHHHHPQPRRPQTLALTI